MSHPRDYWNELTATALVGSGRRPVLPPAAEPLSGLIAGLDPSEPAAVLLGAAAATTLLLHAGHMPAALPPIPECDAHDLRACGSVTTGHLAQMLSGTNRGALAEWLAELVRLRLRAPAVLLPELLDLGRQQTELRALLIEAIGVRGRWLAAQNTAWAYAAVGGGHSATSDAGIAEAWETGGRAARLHLLESLRHAEPDRARALIESTWTSEKSDDRVAFVDALAIGISAADEPFLESALDDRSKDVRTHTADLLARMADSRLATRMIERALPLLRRQRGWRTRIEVTLPTECDKAMQRDGIVGKPPQNVGKRAWWLLSLIERTPPAAWCRAWNLQPGEIMHTELPNEWRALIRKGWAAAAQRYGDLAWLDALLSQVLQSKEPDIDIGALVVALPTERREAALLSLLHSHNRPLDPAHPAFGPLRQHRSLWSSDLSRAVIDKLRWRVRALDQSSAASEWELRVALAEFSGRIHPGLADEAAQIWPTEQRSWQIWGDMIGAFDELLHFRRDMLVALHTNDLIPA